jgi:thiamine-monophosphate kinase
MAAILGYSDTYYRGWLLATINLSDLAAVGARPLGLLTSLILRNDMTVEHLLRLLDGIDDCCGACGTQVIGGNIKEGIKIDLSATAIGVCVNGKFLPRVGCQVGDHIVIIGDLGLFWAGVLAVRRQISLGERDESILKAILTPTPKVRVGEEIANKELLTACLDNSDGVYPSLAQLAESNGLQMCMNTQDIVFSSDVLYVSSQLGIDPVRLSLGWGDWQLIGCCRPTRLKELEETAKKHAAHVYVLGEVREGQGVTLNHKGASGPMAPIDSQRFTKDSWFTAGIEAYERMLIDGPLWKTD